MAILSKEKVQDVKDGNADVDWILWLCVSHEELRRERDELLEKCRKLILEKATIRETKDAESSTGTR